jgi:hypothetical protein
VDLSKEAGQSLFAPSILLRISMVPQLELGISNEPGLLISTREVEAHEIVQTQLAGARNRSFECPSQLKAVLRHMTQADVHSSGGVYLGSAPAFNLDTPVMDSFFHRVVRGLLHEERQCGFLPCTIQWRLSPDRVVYADFVRVGRSRSIGDIFSYSALFLEGHLASIWLLSFYGRLRFIVHLQPSVA